MQEHQEQWELYIHTPNFFMNFNVSKFYPKMRPQKYSSDAGLKAIFQSKSPQIKKAGGKICQIKIKIRDKNETYKTDTSRRISPKTKIE